MINEIVINALTDITEGKIEFDLSTQIFGDGSVIDSMDLVNCILAIEEILADEHGLEIEIIDEEAIIGEQSPFQTVQKLIDHINSKSNN